MYDYARNLLTLGGKDAADEVAWLAKSANRGSVAAQYRLGLILYEGKMAQRDNVAAGQWIYLASDHGQVEARRLLKEMQLFLTADELKQARQRADTFKPLKKKPTHLNAMNAPDPIRLGNPGTAPNVGPATPVGNSGIVEEPPSVS